MANYGDYEPVIGIETHVQLKTKTKLFCSCLNDSTVDEPNLNICPVCMGMPGTLPVLNEAAVKLALRVGLALNGAVAHETKFDRKNYFYPDLPKGYQISQYDQPIIGQGYVEVPFDSGSFRVRIVRAHLEEDAGKLLHPNGADYSLLDLNRAGTPLVEVVSEPDIHSPAQAKAYVQEVYNLMRYADVSSVDLYRGNMRFDVNVSVRKKGDKKLGVRSETKNLNSFRSVEKAAEYEIKRQIGLIEKGEKVLQETRGWDDAKGKTLSQRSKEEAHDYRYFPEPDIPPLVITRAMLDETKKHMPVLPSAIRIELVGLGIDKESIEIILGNPEHALLFRDLAQKGEKQTARAVANYYRGKIRAYLKEHPDSALVLDIQKLIRLYEMQSSGKVNSSAAAAILLEMIETNEAPEKIADRRNLLQLSDDTDLGKIVSAVIKGNQPAVEDYKEGNENSLQFLVGQVMKESGGRANPQVARELLLKKLK